MEPTEPVTRMRFPGVPRSVYLAYGEKGIKLFTDATKPRLWLHVDDLGLIVRGALKAKTKKEQQARVVEALKCRARALDLNWRS